jgi:hypothetical protein
MPQVSEREYEALPLRVHDFLADVPLHDVWAVDLPRVRPGVTLDAFLRSAGGRLFAPAPIVRGLLRVRLFVGRLFRWDSAPSEAVSATFAERLTPTDRASSLVPVGVCVGPFDVVYRFENEQLGEVINKTVHAAALTVLVEMASSYRFYFAVYVRNVGRLTPLYMALIDPFRKLIVYPSLLRSVRATWNETFGACSTVNDSALQDGLCDK